MIRRTLTLALLAPAAIHREAPPPPAEPVLPRATKLAPNFPETPAGVAAFIKAVTPRMVGHDADRIAAAIVQAAKRHHVNPLLLAAIVRYESGFRRDLCVCAKHGCDHGLGQINDVHVEALGLDAQRLDHDDTYNLDIAARLLAKEKRRAGGDLLWWSRYHDRRPKPRRTWEARVLPFLKVANG